MKPEEIYICLFQVNLNFSEKNFKFPTAEILKPIFDYFISYFTGKKIDQICQIEILALDRLSNPELHEESFNTLLYLRLLQKMAILSGTENFSLRDYFDPLSKRIRLILSALINFGKFKEEICSYTKNFDQYTLKIYIKGNYSGINSKIWKKKTQNSTFFFKEFFIYLPRYHKVYKKVKFFLKFLRIELMFGYFRLLYIISKNNYNIGKFINIVLTFRKIFFLNKFSKKPKNKYCVLKTNISVFQKISKTYFNFLNIIFFLKVFQGKNLYNICFFLKNFFGGGNFFNLWGSIVPKLPFLKNNIFFFLEMQKDKKELLKLKLFNVRIKSYGYKFFEVYFNCITLSFFLKFLMLPKKFFEQKNGKKYFYKKIRIMNTTYKKPIKVKNFKAKY